MLKIYSSSAGSGKTYTLTKEYLKLALQTSSETYYRHILAVTFTNAAAAEMKERILLMLRTFGEQSDKDHPMLIDITRELHPDLESNSSEFKSAKEILQKKAKATFQKILHGYSDFAVMTIDSFMSKLVSSFTDELGLPFNFDTILENDILTDALDRVIAKVGQRGQEELTSLLQNYFNENAQEGKGWTSLTDNIRKTAESLLQEKGYLALNKVENFEVADWLEIRTKIRKRILELETQITDYAQKGFETIQKSGLTASDFSQGLKGIYGYFESRANKTDNHWKEPNSYVLKTINEDKWHNAKKTGGTTLEQISSELSSRFQQIVAITEGELKNVTLYQLLVNQLYNLSLLNEIKKEQSTLLKARQQVHISEFNQMVLQVVSNDPVPFIYERLGEKYNHILIDEFQDTSKLQFANLLPLIENALANGFFNLVVGDVKQSIYRFRGGDMDLLLHLSNKTASELRDFIGDDNPFLGDRLYQLDRHSELARLTTNRRSFSAITEFNNHFFESIKQIPELNSNLLIHQVYDEHFQQEIGPTAPRGGHVQIEFLESEATELDVEEEEVEINSPQILRTTELISELIATGYQYKDIAILCREKRNSNALANYFIEQKLPVISDDSLTLGNSQVVQLLVAFLQVIYTPESTLARLSLGRLFLETITPDSTTNTDFESILKLSKGESLYSFTEFLKERGFEFNAYLLAQLGVYEVIENIVSKLGIYELAQDLDYVFRFIDEAHNFSIKRTNNIGDFLKWWNRSGQAKSVAVPSSTNAIRITTIHKSKGLEYPVVIIPYTHWATVPKPKSLLWVDLEQQNDPFLVTESGKQLKTATVPIKKDMEKTVLADQYLDEASRTTLENLNLLYVAFTRPVQQLYILADKPKDKTSAPSPAVNKMLKDYLIYTDLWSEEKLVYTISQHEGEVFHAHSKSSGSDYSPQRLNTPFKASNLQLKRNAERIFDTETFEKKRDIFYKLRHVLSSLHEYKELQQLLSNLTREGIIHENDLASLQSKAESILTHPLIQPVFDGKKHLPVDLLLPGGELAQVHKVVRLDKNKIAIVVFDVGKQKKITPYQELKEAYNKAGFSDVQFIYTNLIDGTIIELS